MSSPGALVVSRSPLRRRSFTCVPDLSAVTCNETDTRIDPSRYFNLSAASTKVFKTAGGRTSSVISNIYYADQATRIGMIIVVQHTSALTFTPYHHRYKQLT